MAIYPYHPLKEKTGCLVSQKEHTVIVEKKKSVQLQLYKKNKK